MYILSLPTYVGFVVTSDAHLGAVRACEINAKLFLWGFLKEIKNNDYKNKIIWQIVLCSLATKLFIFPIMIILSHLYARLLFTCSFKRKSIKKFKEMAWPKSILSSAAAANNEKWRQTRLYPGTKAYNSMNSNISRTIVYCVYFAYVHDAQCFNVGSIIHKLS